MFNDASLRIADAGIDLRAVARSARDLPLPDPGDLLRRADVPRRVEAALDDASAAVRGIVERLPGRRRRRRLPTLLAGLVVGVLATLGVSIWWMRRSSAQTAARARIVVDDRVFDQAALDRAGDEGMPVAPGRDGTLSDSDG